MIQLQRPPKEFNPKKRLGLVHVYTGTGEGKTTTALGVALKAVGHNLRVVVIQFLKGHKDYGEMLIQQRLQPQLEVVQFGSTQPVRLETPSGLDLYLAQQGLEYARRVMVLRRPDVLILDEINPVLHHGLLDTKAILDFLDNKHQQTEVILTGEQAPADLLNAADIVSVMTNTKHLQADEFVPRFGIEH